MAQATKSTSSAICKCGKESKYTWINIRVCQSCYDELRGAKTEQPSLQEYKARPYSRISKFVEKIGDGSERLGTTQQRMALVQKYRVMEEALEYLRKVSEFHEDTINNALDYDPLADNQ